MNKVKLGKVLRLHKKWIDQEKGGVSANLEYSYLQDADLRRANLQGADLRSTNLREADLGYANLRRAKLERANLLKANLEIADLRDANLRSADLLGANLQGADLQGADLRSADLRYADLRCAGLEGVTLRGANLRGADLQHVTLLGADLRSADLRHADLRHAVLEGANLQGANLHGATLNTPVKNPSEIIKKVFTEVREKFFEHEIDQSNGSCGTSACIGGKLAVYYHGEMAEDYAQGADALAKDIGLANEGMLRAWIIQTGLWWNEHASQVFASDVTAYAEEGSDINVEIVCNRWIDFAHKLGKRVKEINRVFKKGTVGDRRGTEKWR